MRKVEPLERGARPATRPGSPACAARRRPTRADTPLVDWDEQRGLVKLNPLAAWTFDDVVDYANEHRVLVNPLLPTATRRSAARRAPSAVAPGEDPRAGRWAGLAKTECGLHT